MDTQKRTAPHRPPTGRFVLAYIVATILVTLGADALARYLLLSDIVNDGGNPFVLLAYPILFSPLLMIPLFAIHASSFNKALKPSAVRIFPIGHIFGFSLILLLAIIVSSFGLRIAVLYLVF